MRKFLLLIMAIVSMTVSTAATKLIREDRVWEYSRYMGRYYVFVKMKFEGTEDVDGKTYHKFITKEITGCNWTEVGEDREYIKYVITQEPYTYHETLIREEEGRIYYRVNKDLWHEDIFGDVGEHLLYDFNLSKGDTLKGVSDASMPCDFEITSTEDVIIDGEECKLQCSGNIPEIPEQNLHFLEGIGAIYFCSSMTHITQSFTPGMHDDWYTLHRVFNSKGEVIWPVKGKGYPLEIIDDWDMPSPDVEGEVILRNPLAGVESVTDSDTENAPRYTDGTVSADGCQITIHDMTGKCVASGRDNVSTSTLPAGIYIARTDSNRTLKIIVR